MTYLALVATLAALLGAAQMFSLFHVAALRRTGRYPERGQATMADVEELLNTGARRLALRCYREIHACSLREASDAVCALSAPR